MSEERERLADEALPVTNAIADKLRAAVLGGDMAPGERLYEVQLAERLGVSRTPVRAALQALAADGLLDYVPRRGYRVRSFDPDELLQAYEIRAVLEGLAAKRAAQNGLSEAERRSFENALDEGDRLLARGRLTTEDRITYGAINFAIHTAILGAGGSRLLADMLRLAQQFAPSTYRHVVAFEFQDVRRRHEDHHRIFEAILFRDPGRAELAMREHVERVKISLIRSVSRAGSSAGSS